MHIIFEKDNIGRTILELIFVNRGSIYAKDGVSYITSYIINRFGTLSKKEKFFSKLEENAISINSTANREYFSINIKFLNNKKRVALKALEELLSEPNFTVQTLEKAKQEIKEKIKAKENNLDYVANLNLFKAIFKGTPLANRVEGENIEDINLKDIQTFFSTLSTKNLIIINGGEKINLDKILNKLDQETYFKSKFFKIKNNSITQKRETEQSYIYFASEFNLEMEEYYLAKVATFILGSGGFGSRIMEEIRVKRGFAYSAYINNSFQKSFRILKGHMQTKLENQDNAIKVLKEVIKDFTTNGITNEELEQAKKFLIGSEPLKNETLYNRLAKKFNEIYLELPENYYEKELELIKDLDLNTINNFITNHKEINNLNFSIITNNDRNTTK